MWGEIARLGMELITQLAPRCGLSSMQSPNLWWVATNHRVQMY